MLLNLSESEIYHLKLIAKRKGLSVSGYVGLLARTAVVYHNLRGKEEFYVETKESNES